MSDETVFALRELGVSRGGRALVDGVSLDVRAGEVLAIMGENGAGKSTLLRLMAGDLAPDRGAVLLRGEPLATWSARDQARARAVMPQQSSMSFAFSAFDVVLLGRSPHDAGQPGDVDRAIARDAMRRTDAWQFAGRSYPTLSGGERARVMLARAFAQVLRAPDDADARPRALLLDEPSAALDIAHQHAAFGAIRALAAAERVAVVAVLHDPNLAAAHADRVALLRQGRLMATGSVDETLTEPLMSACFSIAMRRLRHPGRDIPLLVATTGEADRGRVAIDAETGTCVPGDGPSFLSFGGPVMHATHDPASADLEAIAAETGFSVDAVRAMARSIAHGGGRMGQFDHPAFGGPGQWMDGGMLMISDPFDQALKQRIARLCARLAERGAVDAGSTASAPSVDAASTWYPAGLGVPSMSGAQDRTRYAWFAGPGRLAVDDGGRVTLYDTGDHRIGGVSQQRGGGATMVFTSQHGPVDVAGLPVVEGSQRPDAAATLPPSSSSPSSAAIDPFAALEKLAALHARGIVDDDEFAAKRIELLERI